MGYQLYKQDNNKYVKISFKDLDDKAFWCNHGKKQEDAFVRFSKNYSLGFKIETHPEKEKNPFHPDLLIDNIGIGEVKTKNSPLFFGERYGVNPQFALTMDLKDSFNYCRWLKKGIDIRIFAWVKWEAHKMECNGSDYFVKPMSGVWTCNFSVLRTKETSSNPPKIHWYKENFRQPSFHSEDEWTNELIEFEPRLRISTNKGILSASNVSSEGYICSGGIKFPKGQSSCSYVFDLSDSTIFERLL